jgi:hypothetical protein
MPTVSEIDHDIRNAKASNVRYWFIMGHIGEATFRASLHILGLRGQDVDSEVALAKLEKRTEARRAF